jgi:hypothetical protein
MYFIHYGALQVRHLTGSLMFTYKEGISFDSTVITFNCNLD